MESDGGSVIFSDTEHQQTQQKIDDLEMELRWCFKHAHVQKKYVCGSSQVALFDNASNLIWDDDIYKMVPRDWYGGTGLDHTWNQDLQDLESCEIEPKGKGLYYIIHILDRCNATNTDPQSCLGALTKVEAPEVVYIMSNASHRTDTGHIKHHRPMEDVDEAKLIYPKAIELDHGEPLCLKHTGLRQRALLSFELYSHLRAWVSRAYHSIKTLDLDLIFPTEQNLESNTARSALKVALASIASLTAIIASQYNPQRLLPRVSQQTYLLRAHDRLETLLAPSAPIFVTSCATCYGATILLHHLHSPDSYQNLFVTAGALCGLLFDLRSENWVSVGRSVPMFITIAMILSIVRHGFFQPFLNARALKAVDRFGNEGTVGGTAIEGEEKSFWIQENS
ncbi:hypothetical protein MMC22_006840 [Lobaria immixta]|nr:hypothetical protein [Lobaria immixta]